MLDASALRITEFVASNDNSLSDFQGESSDWLEIFNPSATEANLSGFYLTDNSNSKTKWQFPTGTTIEPASFLVVFASDKNLVATNGEIHTNFKLSADGEYLGLIAADGQTVIDAFTPGFPAQSEDISYGLAMASSEAVLVGEGATARAWVPTSGTYGTTWTGTQFNDNVFNIVGVTGFGYESASNPVPNYQNEYNTAVPASTSGLYVRVPFSLTSLNGIERLTLRMKYDDGFVAYLNGAKIASANAPTTTVWNSTATTFHDDFDAIQYQEFDITAAIPGLIQGNNILAIHGLNFGQGSSDFLIVPELVASQTSIASPLFVGYFPEPTPGQRNGEAYAGLAIEPTFSVPHGFYSSTQQVSISTTTPGALIVYTTDGSTPAVDANLTPIVGQAYTGPIAVSSTRTLRAIAFKQNFRPSFVKSASYLFLNDIVNQSPAGQAPAGWPSGSVNGQLLDYGIDPDIIALYGAQAVKDSLTSIPTITLTTDVANLFSSQTGIYVNSLNRGAEWERPTSVELVNPNGTPGFATNAGLRIRGGYGRNDFNAKHAFRLYFRSEYGDGKLNYPLFGTEGVDEFDVLDLRTSSNYSWAGWGDSVNGLQNSYLREVFARDTQADLDQPYTRSRYYHLYLNGQYWGLYMSQERIQEDYGASYFGGDAENYDVVKADSTEAYTTEIADGNDLAWQQLFSSAQQLADNPSVYANNFWAMQGLNPDGTRDENLEVLLDVDNLIDYMMIIIYTGGHDTGISAFLGNDRANNWFGIRNRETGDMGFQFFLHDNEHSLGSGEVNGTLHGTVDIDRTGPFNADTDDDYVFFNPVYLHQDLLAHPEYVQRFADRAQLLLADGGILSAAASISRMEERKNQVDPAIIAEAARWGDAKRSNPYTKADWQAEVDWLLNNYFPIRGDMVVGHLRADGLINEVAVPVFSQLGGAVLNGYPLQLSTSEGTVYYSLDGVTDPREIGGDLNSSPQVQSYTGPILIVEQTTVKARTLNNSGEWSGIVEVTFTVPKLVGDYDPNGYVDADDYEVWENSLGSTTNLAADGNSNGIIDQLDQLIWQNAFVQQPTVVASAIASSPMVTGNTTNLSVLGGMQLGEGTLTYTWAVIGPGEVNFGSNGTNASKNTTATFTKAGTYEFVAIIENPGFKSVATSVVLVTVEQVSSGMVIVPEQSQVAAGNHVHLAVFETDQFGDPIDTPPGLLWSISSGGGTISQYGLFSAPSTSGTTIVAVTSSSGSATAALTIVTPAARYEANSTSGTSLLDSSGNGKHGNVIGSASWQPGFIGNAVSLGGGYVDLPDGIVSGMGDITISTWFNLNSVAQWSRIFDFGSGTAVNMFLTPQSGAGTLRFAIKPAGQGEQQINGPAIAAGQWYHVAVTIEGNTGTLYLNGVPVGTNTNMTFNPADLGFTTQNFLGDSQYASDPSLLGRIDDFRIYANALTPYQVMQLANLNTPPVAQGAVVSLDENQTYAFQVSDFAFADGEGNSLTSITVSNLQLAAGDSLTVNQGSGPVAITNGMTITAAQIASLVYTPASNVSGNARSTFEFSVNDSGLGLTTATMTINVLPVVVPSVTGIQINDGAPSRSMISSLRVNFNTTVDHTALASAFALTNISTGQSITTLQLQAVDIGNTTVVTISFATGTSVINRSGTGLRGNSLADGNYRLDISAQSILSTISNTAMASNYVFGGKTKSDPSDVDKFYRLLGDANGDGAVNVVDRSVFSSIFLIPASYRSDLDTNGDGVINVVDRTGFSGNFSKVRP